MKKHIGIAEDDALKGARVVHYDRGGKSIDDFMEENFGLFHEDIFEGEEEPSEIIVLDVD